MPPEERDEDRRLHDLFAAFRDRIYPPRPSHWRDRVREGVSNVHSSRHRGPSLTAVLGAGLVQILNLLGGVVPSRRDPGSRLPDKDAPDD